MKACVDIGGTKVAVGLAPPGTGPRALQARRAEPTAKTGPPGALAAQVLRMLDAACAEAGVARADLRAVGVAACGPFALQGGAVELATPNICGGLAEPGTGPANHWTSAPLQAPLAEALGPGVVLAVENDAVAALRAERLWGALRGVRNAAYVTWSTGIGVGLCVDGRVLRGKAGNAGHAGHSFASDGPAWALCGCGNQGDVESLAAGGSMQRLHGRDAGALIEAAQAGDPVARAAVAQACRVLGRMLYNLVVALDLERISLGGAVLLHHAPYLLPQLRSEVEGRLPALTRGVGIVPAGLGLAVGDYAPLALVEALAGSH